MKSRLFFLQMFYPHKVNTGVSYPMLDLIQNTDFSSIKYIGIAYIRNNVPTKRGVK